MNSSTRHIFGNVNHPLLLLTAAFLGVAMQAAAAEDKIDCNNAITQSDMTQCAYLDWQKADAELNAVYKTALTQMRETDSDLPEDLKGAEKTLKEAQRAWLPYRDKACDSYGFIARGGSMEPMLVNSCLADITRQRTQQLKDLAEGLGN